MKNKKSNKLNRYFLLNTKRFLIILALLIIAVLLHNFVSAIIGAEEALFFILAIFIIPIYFLISLIYTLYKKLK